MQQGPRVVVDRSGLRHPEAPLRRSPRRGPDHREADGRGHVRRPRVDHAADHRARVGVRPDRHDARASSASTGSATARTPPTRACRSRTPGSIKQPAVWDALGAQGKRSVLIGVPPCVPAARRSSRVGAWAASSRRPRPSAGPIPQELEVEIEEELGGKGEYIFDIPNFRQAGFDVTLDQVFKMTERRFQVGRRLIQNKPWDFFMLCDIAPDRLHHVFWQYYDKRHPLYEAGQPVRGRVPGLLPVPGPPARRLPRARARGRRHDRDERPRRAPDDGRPVLQRLADPGGLPRRSPSRSPTGPIPIKDASIDWSRTGRLG